MLISISCLKTPSNSLLQIRCWPLKRTYTACCHVAPAQPASFNHPHCPAHIASVLVTTSWTACRFSQRSSVQCAWFPATAVPEHLQLVLQVPTQGIPPLWNASWPCLCPLKLALLPSLLPQACVSTFTVHTTRSAVRQQGNNYRATPTVEKWCVIFLITCSLLFWYIREQIYQLPLQLVSPSLSQTHISFTHTYTHRERTV